jgi:uncharacterized protein with GYD domain
VKFLMLLRLTAHGREHPEAAASRLQVAAEEVVPETDGAVESWFMTYGQYDAYIAGTCPNSGALAGFAAWFVQEGFFSSETLTGFEPQTFVPMHHG